MPEPRTTHLDYAEEAQAAERAEAWPQAAALWRRAAECLPKHPCSRAAADREQYLANAEACNHRHAIDSKLEQIASSVLKVPTLRSRHSDRLDFHELSVWQIKLALRAAYEAGRQAERAK